MITQSQVSDCFEYRDGQLYWKRVAHPNKQYLVGQEARAKFHGQFAHQSLKQRVALLEGN